jgi:NADPH:quinone reductase-like Zn-dependent oxidoreductase
MRAIKIDRYGGADAMEFADLPDPDAGADDVLIEVHAASVNPIDWKTREGHVAKVRPMTFPGVLGRDFSGTVREVGANVTGIEPGDEVFGIAQTERWGTHAELLAVTAAQVARKPANLSHVEAASLPIAALTAICALEGATRLAPGEEILIHAGAGGVGMAAIQYAKHVGAQVATTASADNADAVRELGADYVIDYKTEDFVEHAHDIDVVLDTMGGETHLRSFEVLKPEGRLVYISAAPIPDGPPPRDDVDVIFSLLQPNSERLSRLRQLVESGAIAPQVGTVLPLSDAATAYNMVQTGQRKGKVVLQVR